MVADIFERFEPPSKKFLATALSLKPPVKYFIFSKVALQLYLI